MKKKLAATLSAVMLLATSLCIMTSAAAPLRVGDINLDGKLDIVDLVRLKKALLYDVELDGVEVLQADTDENGAVEASDLVVLRKALLNGVEYGDNEISIADLK